MLLRPGATQPQSAAGGVGATSRHWHWQIADGAGSTLKIPVSEVKAWPPRAELAITPRLAVRAALCHSTMSRSALARDEKRQAHQAMLNMQAKQEQMARKQEQIPNPALGQWGQEMSAPPPGGALGAPQMPPPMVRARGNDTARDCDRSRQPWWYGAARQPHPQRRPLSLPTPSPDPSNSLTTVPATPPGHPVNRTCLLAPRATRRRAEGMVEGTRPEGHQASAPASRISRTCSLSAPASCPTLAPVSHMAHPVAAAVAAAVNAGATGT